VTSAFTYAMSQRYLGEPARIGQAYGFVIGRVGAILWTTLLRFAALFGLVIAVSLPLGVLMGAAISLGADDVGLLLTMLLIAAMAILWFHVFLRLELSFAALVVESRKGFAALNRAWRLSAGYGWRTVGMLLVTYVIVGVISLLLTKPVEMAAAPLVKAGNLGAAGAILGAANAVVETALAPVVCIVLVLVYYDLRIRKEGFDLQMLARDMAASTGQPLPEMFYDEEQAPTPVAPSPTAPCSLCGLAIDSAEASLKCSACGWVVHRRCWDPVCGCRNPACPTGVGPGAPAT
jgi:hypothetical protein